jgi:hypothetical protein
MVWRHWAIVDVPLAVQCLLYVSGAVFFVRWVLGALGLASAARLAVQHSPEARDGRRLLLMQPPTSIPQERRPRPAVGAAGPPPPALQGDPRV